MKKLVAIALGVALAGVGTVAVASRNSSGTHTLPAGNPVVSGTSISTTWANNTLGDISQSLTDSLDRNGKGGMLAPLRTPNGSVTAPTHSFTNDTDTGLYLIGDANPAVAVAGAKRQEWTAAGSKVTGTLEVTGASTITGVATLAATPVLQAGASVASGDLTLSQAATQKIAKTGGTLNIGTEDANVVQFLINGAAVAGFQADGDLGMGLHKIQDVATPTLSGDGATKGYVDAAAPAQSKIVAGGIVTGTTGTLYGGFGATVVRNSLGVYTVTLSASYTNNTPVASAAGTVPGAVTVQVTAANTVKIRTFNPTTGAVDDRDFSFYVIAGP